MKAAKILVGVLLFLVLVRLPNPPGIVEIGTIETRSDGWVYVKDWSLEGLDENAFHKWYRSVIPSSKPTADFSMMDWPEGQLEWIARHRWLFEW